ncbi:hypothetical protein C9426_15015 [Serratia sp. S1B]|nr:hypothetical protein C9426_15015 [Serratia sp. S1B]
MISRWAPPNENNTQAYINGVARITGVGKDQPIDTNSDDFMEKLLTAIIQHENGIQPYSADVLRKALTLARG